MKKGFLRFIAVAMAVLMAVVYLPVSEIDSVLGVEASALTSNNNSMGSSSAKWSYNTSNKTLTISGSGAMPNYSDTPDAFADYNWRLVVTIMNNAKTIVINNGITSIGNCVFKGFKNVTSVTIPASVTSIGNDAFRDMSSLSGITIPSAVKTIGARAFQGCSSLKNVNIPAGVTVINNDTFYGCSSLTSVNLNEGITSIGANAFRDTKVSAVDMPYSVKSIGSNAFSTVKITCNYNDPAYKYCASHANATAVLRTPSLKAEILPGSAADITVALYVKDASGFNAGNFTVEYNADISPVSSDYTYNEAANVATAVVFGSGKVNIAVSAATSISYADCGSECSYKIAEISFKLAPKTHVAKVTMSSSVLMLCDKRYTPASTFTEYGEHNFVAQSAPVSATCTTYGYTLYKCSICEEEREKDIVDALGHNYGEGVVTPPTCEEGGYTSYTCSRCNDVKKDSFTEATGHSTREVVIDATCQSKGSQKIVCDGCKKETVEEFDINPDNHVATEVRDEKAATCSAKGYTGDTYCTGCGVMTAKGTEIATTSHAYESVVTAPTCTSKGYTTHTCKDCGASYKDSETAVAAHTYESVVTAPTCQATGYTTHTCTVCGHSYKDSETAVAAHTYESVVTAPTCQATGYTTHTCTVCGHSYKDSETAVVEHKYEMTVTTAPTCQTKGEASYKCEYCGTSYNDVLDIIAHEYESVVTAPTCQATGYTTYTCKYCGTTYTADETPVTDHKFAETSRKEATCSAAGSVTYKCETCDEAYSEAIPVASHDYESVVTEATCKDYGYTTYTCKSCGDTYKVDGDKLSSHDYESVVTEATCKDYGYATYTCKICGDTYKVETDELASHNYESVVTAATCTQAGFTTFTCSVCGHSYKGVFTAALGHEYDEDGNCIRCYTEPSDMVLAFNDTATYIINETDKTVLVRKCLTAAELKAAITTKGWVITAADGSSLADDKAVATGSCIRSEDGSLVYKVAIIGDVNLDGKVSAADARIALRVAARIDAAEPVAQLAANCDGKPNVTASDARIILRVSARLQTF